MNETERTVDIAEEPDQKTDRRNILGSSALAAAVAAMWRPQPAEAHSWPLRRGRSLIFDVACLGSTFAANRDGAIDLPNGDLRGISFVVEGLIFPAWTLPNGVEVDVDELPAAVGEWFCRGWFVSHPGRPLPFTMNVQEYVLEPITPDNVSPAHTLTTSGPEGAGETFVRAVVGGTGRYRAASGEAVMETVGTNSSLLRGPGTPSPNFRFYFDFANGRR